MDTKKEKGQFYCEVCDCELKDSANYLDHINGKRHNRNKGINLKQFQDSTLEEVKEMLIKKRKERDDRISTINESTEAEMSLPGERNYFEDQDEADEDDDEADDG